MPCQSNFDGDESATKKELDEVTSMLCSVLKLIENSNRPITINSVPKPIRAWWTNHKRLDAEREEREARERKDEELRQEALQRLSTEERRALGIRG